MFFEYIVAFAVFLSNVANFPQIHQILKTKKAKDLSLSTFMLWDIITFIMMLHSFMINDVYFQISMVGQFIIDIIMTILIVKFR